MVFRVGGGQDGLLLGLALIGHGVHCSRDGVLVTQVVAFDRLEVVVQFVNQWNAGWNVELEDLLLGEVVEILHKRAEAVAVGGDDHPLAGLHGRGDFFMPEREEALDGVLQALGEGQLRLGDSRIAWVVTGPALIRFLEWWWRNVIAAAPDENLLVAELCGGLGFVEALERAVVAFVETPVLFHGNPDLIELGQDAPERVEGAFQDRHIGDVEGEALLFQKLAGSFRLGAAFVAEFDIVPASEAVFFVPGAFAVADEDKFMH